MAVDTETGHVEILSHAIADDCGTMINPIAVKGQMFGAAAMGLGGALSEHLIYDEEGRLRSPGLKSYLMPRADDLPSFDFAHQITPSPFTSLGTKGAGEAGVGGASAAVTNAVNDALAPFGVLLTQLPFTPPAILKAIRQAATLPQGGHNGS